MLHPVFGPGEDRNTPEWPLVVVIVDELHPVFGPGEDRNRRLVPAACRSIRLHPVFGPGEDRNSNLREQHKALYQLHPVFGPGEDRNWVCSAGNARDPALHPVFGPGEDRNDVDGERLYVGDRCTRSSDRVRIATWSATWPTRAMRRAAPGLRTG